ncbi:methyl-accepting chemotaxis protein [Marinomonas pollencensis]|uniref:Methyl-accepting chemotaxis protein n=1 Tax=Marinomonas pollencensis TaxID=491954 RepID=A0A3E0DQF2_9GAMM|nr:methyl-accepting chemotaxis protein [Marinomonas pollencensis]REG83742.1 methyl-accepting chemotaxis protein [Marinomonas pollencensis]
MLGFSTIRGRLWGSYLVLFILLLSVLFFSVTRFQFLSNNIKTIVGENAALVDLTGELNVNAESLASRLLMLFVLEDRDARIAIYKEIDDRNRMMDESLAKMETLVQLPEDQQIIERLKNQRGVYQKALQATVEALELGELEEAKNLMAGQTRSDLQTFLDQTSVFADRQQSLIQSKQQQILSETESGIMLILGQGVLALIIGAVMSILITRSIVKPLGQVVQLLDRVAKGDLSHDVRIKQKGEIGLLVESVTSMRTSLAGVIEKIDDSAQTVVAAVKNIRTSMEGVQQGSRQQQTMANDIHGSVGELSEGVKVMAEHLSVSRNQAEAAHHLAQQGKAVITSAAQDITSVAAYIEETSHSVAKLKESTSTVSNLVNSIRNVAEQTNLLALNASIEAARAGESGRGFAVVADEVRNLATSTAEVTESIDKVITDISGLSIQLSDEMSKGQEKMRAGVTHIEEVVAPLSQLEADSAVSLNSLDELSQLAQQQANEVQDIANHTTLIAEVTENNGQTSLRLSQLTDELFDSAEQTREATSIFTLPAR